MPPLVRILFLAWFVAAASGCGTSAPPPRPAPDTRTPLEYFVDTQGATVTPNGRILVDTATERDGKIEYSTEDGKRWRVTYSRMADGTYQYGTPEELTAVEATPEKTTPEDTSNEEQTPDEEVP